MMNNLDKCYFIRFCSCVISVCDWRMCGEFWGNSFCCLYSSFTVWIYSLRRLVQTLLSANTILNLQSAPDTIGWTLLFLFFYDFWIYWRCGWPVSHYDSSSIPSLDLLWNTDWFHCSVSRWVAGRLGFGRLVWVGEVRVWAGRERAVIYTDLTFLQPHN